MFGNETGLSGCHACPVGYFCLVGSITYIDSVCPEGYFCPLETETATANPCPAGTFSNRTGQTDASECLPCPGGYYCDSTDLTASTGLCREGWYCSSGSASATPEKPSDGGGPCKPGFFCPEGSPFQIPCSSGQYCDREKLAAPSGPCMRGFYCVLGSHISTPFGYNDTIGNLCPVGHFCPVNSSYPEPCPPGTYLGTRGNKKIDDCLQCPPGQFCEGYGLESPTGHCSARFYCPGGQNSSTPNELICPAGHHCVEGSHQPARCDPGYYQDIANWPEFLQTVSCWFLL